MNLFVTIHTQVVTEVSGDLDLIATVKYVFFTQ